MEKTCVVLTRAVKSLTAAKRSLPPWYCTSVCVEHFFLSFHVPFFHVSKKCSTGGNDSSPSRILLLSCLRFRIITSLPPSLPFLLSRSPSFH